MNLKRGMNHYADVYMIDYVVPLSLDNRMEHKSTKNTALSRNIESQVISKSSNGNNE